MTTQHTIALEGLEFYAYHGYFAAERELGNRYTVDIRVETDFAEAAQGDALAHTVDYGQLYEIVRTEMAQPTQLLEAVLQRIVERVRTQFPKVNSCQVSLAKHNPPLGGLCQRSVVTIRQSFPAP